VHDPTPSIEVLGVQYSGSAVPLGGHPCPPPPPPCRAVVVTLAVTNTIQVYRIVKAQKGGGAVASFSDTGVEFPRVSCCRFSCAAGIFELESVCGKDAATIMSAVYVPV
jgi:hypothetical protein